MREDAIWTPVTAAQQGIWVLDQIDRLRPSYLLPTVLEFTGAVRHEVLRAAVEHVFGRHPSLRARFRLNHALRQVEYCTEGTVPEVGLIDFERDGWPRKELGRMVEALCYSPFDLAAEAPARAEVLKVDGECTLLVLTVHHIVFDGWSRRLVVDEIATVYRAWCAGVEPGLPSAPHPAEVLRPAAPEDVAEQVAAVVERLRGAPTEIALPYDHPPEDPDLSLVGSSAETKLPADVTERVLAAATAEGATVFMAGVALLAATLARTTAQRDFLFAVVWPGRDDPEAAGVVGMFGTTLVLRMTLDERTTWRELLRQSRAASTAAFVDADAPLPDVAAELAPGRDVARSPLTSVLVNLAEVPEVPVFASGVTVRYRPLEPQYSKFDLALFVRLCEDARLELLLDHPAPLFRPATVAGLLTALRASAAALARSVEETVLAEEPDPVLDPTDPAARRALVRSVWCEVLDTDDVGDDVSFFDAGGDSLRLVILVEKLSQVSGRPLRTTDLFRAGTVRGQAELIAAPAGPASAGTALGSRERLLGALRANSADHDS
ncbi:condensation domain-containing protein [Amycolatopsis sp. FDAARGOS 1241]|uniref:condensation domain-containing protein n=1 Tax=Amycolatopsis sp. FDAARGOS 1241 TaxID=2778070 RepID=UPI00194F94E9|nr:condensation domain-containing protein [Amycolatopsis sp. FDAARGOS 1241]QRP47063.1 condensation protein [Amycolatopsis sp. FDAARGOS 1241]